MSRLPIRQHAVKAKSRRNRRTPAGDHLTALIVPTIRLRALFTAAGEEIARPAGQTLARWLVMEAVVESPRTVAQIARSMGLARQSVQRLADLIERDGLSVYVDNPEHQRAKLVRLTARGRHALQTIQQAQQAWASDVAAEIGETELAQAAAAIDRLLQVLMDRRRKGGY